MPTKAWYMSKTLWLAIAQGVAGIITAIMAADPAVKGVGILASIKSIIDIYIRFQTSTTIA